MPHKKDDDDEEEEDGEEEGGEAEGRVDSAGKGDARGGKDGDAKRGADMVVDDMVSPARRVGGCRILLFGSTPHTLRLLVALRTYVASMVGVLLSCVARARPSRFARQNARIVKMLLFPANRTGYSSRRRLDGYVENEWRVRPAPKEVSMKNAALCCMFLRMEGGALLLEGRRREGAPIFARRVN